MHAGDSNAIYYRQFQWIPACIRTKTVPMRLNMPKQLSTGCSNAGNLADTTDFSILLVKFRNYL